jgi:ABC-type dipeptide/oligopeptide/nickel transport system ATPase component
MGGDIETAPLLQVENLHTYFMTERGLVRAVEGVSFILAQGVTPELVGGPAALVQC